MFRHLCSRHVLGTNRIIQQVTIDVIPEGTRRDRRRKLADKTGNLETLVIRVIASGVQPTANKAQMIDDVFTDQACLKSQYEACSYGQLTIEAYEGNGITGGVVDVSIPTSPSSGRSAMQDAAYDQATADLGDLESQFDLVLFCMPPGSGNWLAYGTCEKQ